MDAREKYVTQARLENKVPVITWLLRRIVVLGQTPSSDELLKKWRNLKKEVEQLHKEINSLLTELKNTGEATKASSWETEIKKVTDAVESARQSTSRSAITGLVSTAKNTVKTAIDAVKDEVQKAKQTAAAKEAASSGKRFTITTDADGKKHLIISPSVTSIKDSEFEGKKLASVMIIPSSVRSIGRGAFNENGLESITIGENVTLIRHSAFRRNKLRSVIIPSSVTSIEGDAFQYNYNLAEVILSKKLYDDMSKKRKIGGIRDLAFQGASQNLKFFEYNENKTGKKGDELK